METLQTNPNPKLQRLNDLLVRVEYGDIIPDLRDTVTPQEVTIEGLQMLIRLNDANLAPAPIHY